MRSVVTARARRRWLLVLAGVLVLACLPAATSLARSALGDAGAVAAPRVLIGRALASAGVEYSGLAESRGNLGLGDLPRFEDVAAEFGSTTRTRVWWAGPQAWRVDVIDSTGEQDVYQLGTRQLRWNYEQNQLTEVFGDPSVRLPRSDDLVAPQAARRVLAGVGRADRVEALPRRSVAGILALGVRIIPADQRSTIGRIDVWVDPVHGLPVAIEAADRHGAVAVVSQFRQLRFGRPDAAALRLPRAPGAVHDSSAAQDFLARFQQTGGWALPSTLFGFVASDPVVGDAATYGTGLTRFVVFPLPPGLARRLVRDARTGGNQALPIPGSSVLIRTDALNLVVIAGERSEPGYLLAGLISADVVIGAARQLAENPPPGRSG